MESLKAKRGHWSDLIWIAIGVWLFKGFAIDAAKEDKHAKENWIHYEATITQSEVHHLGLESGYELHLDFEVDLPTGKRSYHSSNTSSGKYYKKAVKGPYAIGETIEVYINPENPAQYHRPLRQSGLKAIGYLGGGIFALLGLSVLLSKQKPQPN